MSDTQEATVNVSLKSLSSTEPWVTVQGTIDEVRRALWRLSDDAKAPAEAGDFFGAVRAANVEYQNGPSSSPAISNRTAVTREPDLDQATATVAEKLGAKPIQGAGWSSSPPPEPEHNDEGLTPPSCPHGVKRLYNGVYKTGAKQGQPYRAWLCPAERDDPTKCDFQFIND